MRSAALDRRVRREARQLVREARAAAPRLPAGGEAGAARAALEGAAAEVAAALGAGDLARVRRGLPELDALVDELPRRRRSIVVEYAVAFGTLILLVLGIRAFVVEAFKIPSSSMYPTLEINDYIFVNKFVYGLRVPFVDRKLFERSPARGDVIVFIQPCEPDRDYIKRVVAVAGDTVEVRCNVVWVNGRAVPSEPVPGRCEFLDDRSGQWQPEACSRYRETLGGARWETFHDVDRPRREAERREVGGLAHADGNDFPRSTLAPACPAAALAPGPGPRSPGEQLPGHVVRTALALGPLGACEPQLHYVVPEGHVFVLGDNRSRSRDSRAWGAVPLANIKGEALVIWASYAHWSLADWSGVRWRRIGSLVQ